MFGKHVYKIVKDIIRSWKHLQRTKPAFEEFVLTMTGMLGFRHHHQEWCRRKSGLVEEKANTRNTEVQTTQNILESYRNFVQHVMIGFSKYNL